MLLFSYFPRLQSHLQSHHWDHEPSVEAPEFRPTPKAIRPAKGQAKVRWVKALNGSTCGDLWQFGPLPQ